jgi:O-antigen/teichoic acid export membrane protein
MGNDTAGPAIFSLWAPILFWQLQEYLRRMLYTRGRILDAAINTAIANTLRLGLMLWWASRGELDGVNSLTAIGWGSLGALLPGLWQTRRDWSRHFDPLLQVWQRNWHFGRFVLGASVANWVAVEAYPILTAGLISFAAAGAYRAVQNLVQPVQLLLRAIDTFFTPRAAKLYREKGLPAVERMLKRTYLGSSFPVLGLLLLGVLFSKQLLYLLYGETYLEYSPAVAGMAVFYAAWFAYAPLQNALEATRFSRPIFVANLLAILAMFTAGIWMIYTWGVYGTIAGQTLNALVVNVVLWIAWVQIKKINASQSVQ